MLAKSHGRQAAVQAASSKIFISDIFQMRFGEGKMALQIPMLSALRSRILVSMIVSASLVAGCSSAKKTESGDCKLNTDCNQGLVCTWGKCHVACHTSADCPTGKGCIILPDGPTGRSSILDSSKSTVCESPIVCSYNSDCPTELICADGQCRNHCEMDVDCTPGQTCRATKICAEPDHGPLNIYWDNISEFGATISTVLRQPVIRAGEWRETRASSETKGELDHERARVGHEIGIGTKAGTDRRHRLAIHVRVVRVGMAETCADQAARRS
jgi:hypothetical protein